MKLKDLLEKRAKIVADMRAITDKPAGENGDLSTDQVSQFDRHKAELTATEAAIERAQTLAEAERRMAGTPIHGDRGDTYEAALNGYSLRRAIAGAAGLEVDDGQEREVASEVRRRAGRHFQGVAVPSEIFERRVVTTTAPAQGPGGNLVPTDHLASQFIDRLRPTPVVQRLGARILTGLTGNVSIPGLSESAPAGWFAENSAIPTGDPQFRAVTLSPKHIGVISEFSRNMLLQSSPGIEELMRSDMSQTLAELVDEAALRGTGGVQPQGLWGMGGVSVVNGDVSWDTVMELIAVVDDSNSGGTAFTGAPLIRRDLRKTPRQEGGVEGSFIMTEPNSLAGYPFLSSKLTEENGSPMQRALFFGLWSDLIIGQWSGVDILVNPFESTAYSKGNVQVRAIQTVDVEVRHAESFAYAVLG
jgi:HK97 family phage major capsid protein